MQQFSVDLDRNSADAYQMSMRLVKKQLAALSKSTAAVPEGSTDKNALKARDKVQKKRTKKKEKAQQKKVEAKELSEEEVRQRNIAYYARTVSGGKASELMIQVSLGAC